MPNSSKNPKMICCVSFFCRAAVFLLLLFPVSEALFGKSLPEYRKNVEVSKRSVIELLYPNDEDLTNKDYPEFERQTLRQIRAGIPASEKIEWLGAEIETNNQWLIDKLNEYEKEPRNSEKSRAILTEIGGRLEAIEQKLKESENAATAGTKDENKRKLTEILRREEYQKPKPEEESLFQKFYRQFMKWLRDKFPRADLPATGDGGIQSISFVLQMILYALVLGIIGFLFYRFAPLLFRRFRNRERVEKGERVILGERLSSNETAQHLFEEAEKLARTGNLRGAIRKAYIAFLCELSDKKIIGLARSKTNRDYLRDVRKRRELHENLSGLTLNFERHWYGFNEAEDKDWEEFRSVCRKALKSLQAEN